MRCFKLILGACLLLITVSSAHAGLTLTVSQQSTGPLTVGQEAFFAVELSSLPDGTSLDFLSAQLLYDPEILAEVQVLPGQIVTDTQPDNDEFLSAPQSGVVDATYMTFSSDPGKHIQDDGTFFTFSMVPLKEGIGTLEFLFASASAFADPVSVSLPVTSGPSLSYTVVAVPEPSTWIILVVLCFTAYLKLKLR